MRDLLSARDLRYLCILENLFFNKNMTLQQLAENTDSSATSIQNDISNINNFIQPLTITTSLRHGCSLFSPDNYSVDYIYECILKNSLEFSFIELVFFENHSSLNHYADELFISLSTLKRTINKINDVLSHSDIYIQTSPVALVGDEKKLCSFMVQYFIEAYASQPLPFSKIEIETINELIVPIVKKNNFNLTRPDFIRLQIITLVSIFRIKNKHHDEKTISFPKSIDVSILTNVVVAVNFERIFSIRFSPDVLNRIFFPFINGAFAINYQHLELLTQSSPSLLAVLSQINIFLTTISKNLKITLDNRKDLSLALFNVYNMIIGKSYILNNRKKRFTYNFIQHNPHVRKHIYKSIQEASQIKRKFLLYELEELTYIFITHWEGFADKIAHLQPKYLVGLLFNTDDEHIELIRSTLSSKFKDELTFIIMTEISIEDALKSSVQYDFVITNISNLIHADCDFICIDIFPTFQDIQKIQKKYLSLSNFF